MSMDDIDEGNALDLPRVYLVKMMVFTLLVAIIAAILYPQFEKAFMSNPGLNGMIVVVLLLGLGYAFRMVWRLFPEINWVNGFRIGDPGLEVSHTPNLLAPMATLLANRQGSMVLSPTTLRSVLDSLASRLDEARDISRYMIGLLVFLGLLGTFWGLLQTVSSVGDAIKSLDVASAESSTIFEELKSGLEAPLAGMGTSFSSSLFGLAGSLVLGFLDLQASQAQNRFYNSLEDWLASVTDIEIGENAAGAPQYLHMDMAGLQEGIDRMNATLEVALSEPGPSGGGEGGGADPGSIDKLADAVHGLVQQMREEQKIVRQWAQSQTDQQNEIKSLLTAGLQKPATKGNRLRAAIRGAKKPDQGS